MSSVIVAELFHILQKTIHAQLITELVIFVTINHESLITANVLLFNSQMKFVIDSGETSNVLDLQSFQRIKEKVVLQPSMTKLYAYGSNVPLKVKGMFFANVSVNEKSVYTKFIVVDCQQFGSLLSKQTCIDLGLISIHIPVLSAIKSVLSEKSDICARFPTVFEGVGKFKDVSVSIPVDKSVTPVVQSIRRVPFHLRKAVSNKVKSHSENSYKRMFHGNGQKNIKNLLSFFVTALLISQPWQCLIETEKPV